MLVVTSALQVGNFVLQVKKIQVVQLFGQVFAYTFKMGNLFPKLGDLEKTTQVSHLLRSVILGSVYPIDIMGYSCLFLALN